MASNVVDPEQLVPDPAFQKVPDQVCTYVLKHMCS